MDAVPAGLSCRYPASGTEVALGAREAEVWAVDVYESCGGALVIGVDAKVFREAGTMAVAVAVVVVVVVVTMGDGVAGVIGVFYLGARVRC